MTERKLAQHLVYSILKMTEWKSSVFPIFNTPGILPWLWI